jgi:hypothetical protein
VNDDLTGLQAEFPAFRIWQEQFPGRSRYVARSRYPGLNPHTVITTDLRELRDVLPPGPRPGTTARETVPRQLRPVASLTEPERDATSARAARGGCGHE